VAAPQLGEEQIRTWTREQKDRWWLENVYRGDLPQLTLRAALVGFLLGGVLASTNLYVNAKSGWSLGVGVTSVILAFALFRALSGLGMRSFTILENNAVQSVATAAGYMTAPITSSLGAYMVMTNKLLSPTQIFVWMAINSVLGVLIAFPLKRRFINDEQQPFPEGRACAVVLDSLYHDAPAGGVDPAPPVVDHRARWLGELKTRALFGAAGLSALVEFLKLEGYQKLLQQRLPQLVGMRGAEHPHLLPEELLGWYYSLAARYELGLPKILGTDIRQLSINPLLDLTMFGAGGLTGLRTASSLMVGCVLNWFVLAPLMIWLGEIPPQDNGNFGRGYLLNSWCLWWGVAIMVTGSLASLFSKPDLLLSAFRGFFSKQKAPSHDPIAHIELPLWVSWVGIPIVSVVVVWLNWYWFDVHPLYGFLAVPLVLLLTLIAANATALTGTTPTGSLSKISQFTFGALDRTNPATNLMTAGITSEVASNTANLLMDIKPGYMLGAKPRQQVVGHLLGIISGGIAAVMLFFPLFLPHYDPNVELGPQLTKDYPFPNIVLWSGVARLIQEGTKDLATSALVAMGVAAVAGVLLELGRVWSRGRLPLIPVAIGLGVVIPVDSTLMMFAGALFFHWMARRYQRADPLSTGRGLWVESQEPIAAGIVGGAALTGIGEKFVTIFILGE
jgi:OPT family oligopeptide transporter